MPRNKSWIVALLVCLVAGQRTKAAPYSLTTFTVGFNTAAYAINDLGQITGDFDSNPGGRQGFIYDSKSGAITVVPAIPYTINSLGVVGGNGNYGIAGIPNGGGFVYNHGAITAIAYPGHDDTDVFGINDLGEVVGSYIDLTVPGAPQIGFFRDANGAYHTFNLPNGGSFQPVGVNNSGEIVGTYQDSSYHSSPALYNNGVLTILPRSGGQFPPNPIYEVLGINNAGQILLLDGALAPPHGYEILNPDSTLTPVDINFPSSWYYASFSGINDAGQLVGFAETQAGGPTFGVIASPVPEPTSFWLGALGFAAVFAYSGAAAKRRARIRSSFARP